MLSKSFFVFKEKTAYEMRISDWSSDVCSSDLCSARFLGQQVGVMLGLLLPDAAELVIDVAALRIEIIALAVAIQPHALLVAPVEELAERGGARLRHRRVERLGAAGDLAVLTVLLAAQIGRAHV